ncbi:hypothetical protein HY29_18225 [Hyphomonas beringensis]|uniref:Uncharacterized protein n=1 Tax=Hyphomonas beringensis TaxID=1280946 RepID=A0A062U352_9PROT|nr:hypothetical protein HY29_18225 [Hyphomonas beringensis]
MTNFLAPPADQTQKISAIVILITATPNAIWRDRYCAFGISTHPCRKHWATRFTGQGEFSHPPRLNQEIGSKRWQMQMLFALQHSEKAGVWRAFMMEVAGPSKAMVYQVTETHGSGSISRISLMRRVGPDKSNFL